MQRKKLFRALKKTAASLAMISLFVQTASAATWTTTGISTKGIGDSITTSEFNTLLNILRGFSLDDTDGTVGNSDDVLTIGTEGLWSGTEISVAKGGTGATDASGARTNLGLAIGTDVQAFDAQLADVAGLAVTDGNIIVGDGTNFVAESGATARTSLGLTIGTDVQAYDAQLADVAGLAVTDGNIIVGDGTNFVAESADTARTSLGVGSGDSVTFANTTLGTGGAIRTSTSDTNTALIQAYDVDGTAYTTFGTLTAGNTPTFALDPTTLAINGGTAMTAVLDEDDLSSDSATGLATQQSIKAYVDVAIGGISTTSLADADADTKVQVEEGADDDTIRFDSAGAEIATIDGTGLVLATGKALATSTSDTNSLLLQAYDVDGTAYTTFGTLTAGNTPTFDLATGVTMGGNAVHYVGGTDVAVADGGTGASDAGTARTNLGVAIGSDVQAYDAQLADVAGLAVTDGNIIVGDGTNFVAESGATARTSLGVGTGDSPQFTGLTVSGTSASVGGVTYDFPAADGTSGQVLKTDAAGNLDWVSVQASDAELDAIAALAVTDGNIIVGNGTTWVAETGATARTSLGVAIGSDVQAWDNDLDDLAALAQADGNIIVSDGTDWIVESGATARTSLGVGAADSVTFANTTLGTGGAIRTSTSDTNTALIQAYDVDGVAYTTFGTLTAGNTPTFDLDPTSLAIGGGSAMTAILDEDDLTSDSATALATQQSIKAYVDTAVSGGSALIVDADADTQIQVEEGADDDTIRFDAAGTEVVTIVAATTTVGNDLDLDIAQDVIDFSLEEETAKGTCTTANSGQVTYETAANVGTFYGCSQTGASSYAWVQLQVFQQ